MSSDRRSLSNNAVDPKQPRTPSSKITQFFNWKNAASPGDDSSSTDMSDGGASPLPSPTAVSPQTSRYSARSMAYIDPTKANIGLLQDGVHETPPTHPSVAEQDFSMKVGQLEGELREITCELASSIRREMELEDLVEKLQSDALGNNDDTRNSDYYSDSSTSSLPYAGVDGGLKIEDFEKVKRQSEQEVARLKVDLSQKWQDERARRKVLESQIQLLEGQVSQFQSEDANSSKPSSRSKELEASVENSRRHRAEQQQIKEDSENLVAALRKDLEQHRVERNNLRDEVVPQLQAKLLAKSIGPPPPSFDFVRMQQEIQALKSENGALKDAQKALQEMQHGQSRFNTISEEGEASPSSTVRSPVGLNRSNSLARAPSRANGLARSGSLSRSNSTGGKSPVEPRELLVDRMKDVELQRDALHSAMKALLARQECQIKEFQKQIRTLEQERDHAMLPPTPRKQGYQKEVRSLRQEINNLRQRADDALTQKLQCEKGLGGLKMDLDRSEQETSTLRKLLKEHDIDLPEQLSNSLQHAYHQLQQDRKDAEARMEDGSFPRSLEEEERLAGQLKESAERSESLARQMSAQLATNQALRNRLAQAIGRGEKDQTASTGQITELETKLRSLEDTVTLAQQHSEKAVMKHEDEIRILKEAHSAQLQRLKASGYLSPTSPGTTNRRGLSPLISPMFAQRSPKLDKTSSGQGIRLDQALKTEHLEKKVQDLEAALENADEEMQQVVGRMNVAQIEVMELQTER
jgi:DNA repair exonuclease SbcCD ATPase subunit